MKKEVFNNSNITIDTTNGKEFHIEISLRGKHVDFSLNQEQIHLIEYCLSDIYTMAVCGINGRSGVYHIVVNGTQYAISANNLKGDIVMIAASPRQSYVFDMHSICAIDAKRVLGLFTKMAHM